MTSDFYLHHQVTQTDLLSPAPIHLAEKAGQALQVELLRLNESTGESHDPYKDIQASRVTVTTRYVIIYT